jgi:hypothetical protein
MAAMAWKASANVLTREVGGELVLLDLERGVYFGLNEAGRRIWSELISGHDEDETAAILANEFNASADDIRADLAALLEQLVASGLLVRKEEPSI